MSEYYIPRLYRFLRELDANNNREWFYANKARYEDLRGHWLEDLERLIAATGSWYPEMASQTAKTAAYRIYRDTRFTLDKTPYKTYFSAALTPRGRAAVMAGYYIHIGPQVDSNCFDSGVYGGLWNPDAAMLKKMRHAIVDNIEEWEEIVHDKHVERLYPGWCGDTLKTIPKGWDRNHPLAPYLRLKSYGKFRPLDQRFFSDPDWPIHTSELMRPLKPLLKFINFSISEQL